MRSTARILLCIGAALGTYNLAHAQQSDATDYPNQPVTLVVGFSPGGSTDNLARALVDDLSRVLGQPVVVENRPGAGGYVGYRSVAASAPDGYTLLLAENALAIGKALRPDEPLDPLEDLEAVARVSTAPMALIINSELEPDSLEELIEYSKTIPEGLNFSSSGVGSVSHMTFEALSAALDIEGVHVPYRGGGEANAAVVGGHVHAMMQSIGSSARLTEEGGVKPVVVTAAQRVERLPDVPTLDELGVDGSADVELRFWWGLFVANDTPEPIKSRLSDALQEMLADPDVVQRLSNIEVEAAFAPAEEMSALLEREISSWSSLVEERGIQPE